MFYLDVVAKTGSTIARPNPAQQCIIYILEGELDIAGQTYAKDAMVILDDELDMLALGNCRCLLYGGATLTNPPLIEWNFVSFSQQRIEQAKGDWRAQHSPQVPGDSVEFTPLP
jgi:hypothetical protein